MSDLAQWYAREARAVRAHAESVKAEAAERLALGGCPSECKRWTEAAERLARAAEADAAAYADR